MTSINPIYQAWKQKVSPRWTARHCAPRYGRPKRFSTTLRSRQRRSSSPTVSQGWGRERRIGYCATHVFVDVHDLYGPAGGRGSSLPASAQALDSAAVSNQPPFPPPLRPAAPGSTVVFSDEETGTGRRSSLGRSLSRSPSPYGRDLFGVVVLRVRRTRRCAARHAAFPKLPPRFIPTSDQSNVFLFFFAFSRLTFTLLSSLAPADRGSAFARRRRRRASRCGAALVAVLRPPRLPPFRARCAILFFIGGGWLACGRAAYPCCTLTNAGITLPRSHRWRVSAAILTWSASSAPSSA